MGLILPGTLQELVSGRRGCRGVGGGGSGVSGRIGIVSGGGSGRVSGSSRSGGSGGVVGLSVSRAGTYGSGFFVWIRVHYDAHLYALSLQYR